VSGHAKTPAQIAKNGQELSALKRLFPEGGSKLPGEQHACSQCGTWHSCYSRPRLIHEVLDRGAQTVVRGGARCASQVLELGPQADARVATRALNRGVQADSRGAARYALHVHGRGAKADA
jgi:hypothetical protein